MFERSFRALGAAFVALTLFATPLESRATPAGMRIAGATAGFQLTAQSCAAIDGGTVTRLLAQRAAMRGIRNAPLPSEALHERDDPKAFHAFLLRTMPHTSNGVSYHRMTAAEYANFRAAALVDADRVSLATTRSMCLSEVARGRSVNPMWQSGPGGNPCPPVSETTTLGNGTKSTLFWSSACAMKDPTSATVYNSGGAALENAAGTPITITGEPGTNGPIPGEQMSIPTPAGQTANLALPDGAYVPQSGWVQQPSVSLYNGKENSIYLNPSTPSATVVFDANDWGEVSLSGSTYTLYSDIANAPASTTFNVAAINGIQATGDGLLWIGASAGLYALVPTPFSPVFGGIAAVFGALGAGVLLGNDFGLWGGGGSGGCNEARRPVTGRADAMHADDQSCGDDDMW